MASIGNRIGVWLYRRSPDRLSGGSDRVLMLTTPGRRSGLPRTTCMRYLRHEGRYVVWGTASGARHDPDWFRNLRASPTATVQVGREVFTVRRRELVGEERDRIWNDVVLAQV